MKVRITILIINIIALIASWFLLDTDYTDKFIDENFLDKTLLVIGHVYAKLVLIYSLIMGTSIIGTILFGLLKRKDLFMGFLYCVVLNLILLLVVIVAN